METTVTRQRWLDWISLVLGVWLFTMPFFGYLPLASGAAVNGYLFGAIITVISLAALVKEQSWEEWINVAIGMWLIAAPFALGFTANVFAMWSYIVAGLFIAFDALWGALTIPSESERDSGEEHPTHA